MCINRVIAYSKCHLLSSAEQVRESCAYEAYVCIRMTHVKPTPTDQT